jgi:putative DNA primase/helicase
VPSTVEDASHSSAGTREAKVRPGFVPTSTETLTERAITAVLASIIDDDSITPSEIRDALLQRINAELDLENRGRKDFYSPSPQLFKIHALDEMTVARVLLARQRIVAISLTGAHAAEDALLSMYCDMGADEGLYLIDDAPIVRLASQLRPSFSSNAIESLLKRMRTHAEVVTKTTDPHLIPVANGVFDHDQQILLPFSPAYVFLTKSPVDYDESAQNPLIVAPDGDSWDVETWISDLSDDEGVPELLWETLSAIVRPGVRWNKALFLHSSRGNNGKGTFCELGRGLVGQSGHASIPIANFGKPFALSELVRARAIITDENSVGAFAKDLGDFKSVVTGDTFTLDRKYKNPVSVSFSGTVIQCVNDFPKSRDKSASYSRRQLFVPFRKWFGGEGVERGYIKSDYLHRPEVLRYVLRRVLHMTHTELSNPPACQDLLALFQRENDPVRDFAARFGLLEPEDADDEFMWDLLPSSFLHVLFVADFRIRNPAGIPLGDREFASRLAEILIDSSAWRPTRVEATGEPGKERPKGRMDAPEPLIVRFDLKDWMNENYTGSDPNKLCTPAPLKANYRGYVRESAAREGGLA